MLFDAAMAELPLLIFTLCVPVGLMALALVGCVRGFFGAGADAEAARKLDRLALIPVAIVLVGLAGSIMHVGAPAHIFGMFTGLGTSPLSNEIAVAGASIAVAVAYGIIACAKPMGAGVHKGFGVALAVLGAACAVFTGLAYVIPTVVTWDTPYGAVSQLGLALAGGSALAACVFALAKFETSKQANTLLAALAIVGVVGIAAALALQGGVAGSAMSSTGATLAGVMCTYAIVAVVAVVAAAAGVALWLSAALRGKTSAGLATAGFVLVLVGLACTRVDFYGIFLSVGLG